MKAIKLISFFAILVIIGWGCSDSLSPNDRANNNITFQTTQSSYAPEATVTAVLKNNSSRPIDYGHPFQVLQKIDGKWTYIGPDLYFTLEAIRLSPGGQTTYRVALTDSLFPYHQFSGGQYRLTTSVGIGENNYAAKTPPFHVSKKAQQ